MQKAAPLYLKKTEAYARKKLIQSGLEYKMFLCLRKGDVYQGYTSVKFTALSTEEDTFIEYGGASLVHMEINGSKIQNPADIIQANRIKIAKESLVEGENMIVFGYENKYDKDMFGFQSVNDLDGTQYIYIQTVPYYAHRVIPMFDQPDLKGSFDITVIIPEEWTSITTGDLLSRTALDSFAQEHSEGFFNQGLGFFNSYGAIENHFVNNHAISPVLATYNLNLVCGPFEKFDVAVDERYNDIPMSIYCRKPMVEFIEPELENMFEFNKAGIKFYDELFGFPYPYSKMDMIFCPEFAWSAMEYPGAVTYSEKLVPKKQNTVLDRNSRGSTILHEVAHMWFGNLVTMNWWDDLWLNESFADFICTVALEGSLEQLQAKNIDTFDPQVVFLKKKYRGYLQDSSNTTHPISGEVLHTEQATTIFDGITYSKGASTLKCLYTTIGRDAFASAMADYFNKFQYSNSSLQDLLDCVQKYTEIDTGVWRDQWIQKAGYNWLKPDVSVPGKLTIHQGDVNLEYKTLRIHAIKVAFFGPGGEMTKVIDVTVPAEPVFEVDITEVGEFEAVLLNYADQDFVMTKFDDQSLAYFKENADKIKEPISKALVMRAIYDAVFSKEIGTLELIDVFESCMQVETSPQMWEFYFQLALEALAKYTKSGIYNEISNRIYQIIRQKIEQESTTETHRKILIIELIKYSTTSDKAQYLVDWLFGANEYLQFQPTIQQTWKITEMICAYKDTYGEFIDKAMQLCDERDQTDSKIENTLQIKALSADEEERAKLIEIYMGGSHDWSVEQFNKSVNGYTSKHVKKDIKEKYIPYYFDHLLESLRTYSQTYAKIVMYHLFPKDMKMEFCLQRLNALMAETNADESFIRKGLQAKIDELSRKLAENKANVAN